METGLGRPSKPTCGEMHHGYEGVGLGVGGSVWGEKNKTCHLPEGPSGAPVEQGQVGCHLNNVISSAWWRTITGVHFTTWAVVSLSAIPAINSTCVSPSVYVPGWPSVLSRWKGNKTNPCCLLSGCWARWSGRAGGGFRDCRQPWSMRIFTLTMLTPFNSASMISKGNGTFSIFMSREDEHVCKR